MAEKAPISSPGYVPYSLWNHGEVVFPTDPPGWLVIGDGSLQIEYRLAFDDGGFPERAADGYGNVACFQRIPDAAGVVWEARTTFSPHLFVNRLLDLDSLEGPMWAYNDPARVEAVTQRPLITGISVLEDDRFYRRFWVDDALLEIQFKYQGLKIDVGHEDDYSVAVRITGFFGSWAHVPMYGECEVPVWRGGAVRPPESDYEPDEDGLREFPADEPPGGWLENLAPITYSLGVREFLFRNDAHWERTYPTTETLPRPVVFRRVADGTGEPQPQVTHRPT